MTYCFLSYHQEDSAFAQTLKATLEQAGIAVWAVTTTSADPSDTHWDSSVEQALHQAFAVVVVMSPAAASCQHMTYEWAFALGAGVPVLPLLLEPTPSWHPRLALLMYLDFTNPTPAVWDDFILRLRQLVSKGKPTPEGAKAIAADAPTLAPKPARLVSQPQPVTKEPPSATPPEHVAVQETLAESLHHPMRDVRIQASLMLAQFQDVQAIPVLIDALRDRERDVHQHAAWGLMHIGKPAIPALIAALHDEQPTVRKDVARILGQVGAGDEETMTALLAVLHDHASEVRRSAAEALGQLRNPLAVSALRHLLHDEHETVRRSVAESLGKIGEPTAVADLILALEDEHESVRTVAAWALGQIRDAAAIPALVETLRTGNPHLRQAAVDVLKDIGDLSVKTSLSSLLQDEDHEVRRAAARVLAHIRGQQRGIA